ncbi:hypothetical protein FB107DRAFT_280301 [Schizophyllum commune]
MIDATFGEGEGVVLSAARAANITPTALSAAATPYLVNMFIRPFCVASSAPLYPPPRNTSLPFAEATYLRPPSDDLIAPDALRPSPLSPNVYPSAERWSFRSRCAPPFAPSLYRVAPTPLGVEATYHRPPSKGSPRSLRVPPPPPLPMRSPLAFPRRPLDVEATYRRPPSAGPFFALFCVCRRRTTLETPSSPRHPLHSRLQLRHVACALGAETTAFAFAIVADVECLPGVLVLALSGAL